MEILSHRGFWSEPSETNTLTAFRRALESGFGIETDLRDHNGAIVISHDPPSHEAPRFESLLELHQSIDPSLTLALNIKSDGLHSLVSEALNAFQVRSCFVFDMSVPDILGYIASSIPFYARLSEFEIPPALLEQSAGVWVDGFHSDWYGEKDLAPFASLPMCFVSPELHFRDHLTLWNRLATWTSLRDRNTSICTDHPSKARAFFGN